MTTISFWSVLWGDNGVQNENIRNFFARSRIEQVCWVNVLEWFGPKAYRGG